MYGQFTRQQSSPGRMVTAAAPAQVSVDGVSPSHDNPAAQPPVAEHTPAVQHPVHSHHILLEQSAPRQEQPNYMFVDLRTNLGNRYLLRVRDTDTIERIKVKICARLDIPIRQQQLLLNGVELLNHQTVPECGITDSTTLVLVPRLSSGPLRMQPEDQTVDEMVVVESVAAHLTDPKVHEAVANGEPLSFVARIGGRYMMVRLNKPQEQPARCTCNCGRRKAQLASDLADHTPEQQIRDEDLQRTQRENARLRDRVIEIRARLQQRKAASALTAKRMEAQLQAQAAEVPAQETATTMEVDATPSPVKSTPPVSPGKVKSSRKNRCDMCPSKLALVHYPCKCGNTYCGAHKQPTAHSCTYNYRQHLS